MLWGDSEQQILFESVIEKNCMWAAITQITSSEAFSFPQSLCFPYLPYISVRSLCHGQACYMFSCTSARNYPWCCLLLSPSWQIDCISSLWAIHQKLIWAGLNERLHWSRCGALASPDLLNQQSRCNSCWQRLNHFPSTFLFSKRQDLVLS